MNAMKPRSVGWWMVGLVLVASTLVTCSSEQHASSGVTSAGGAAGSGGGSASGGAGGWTDAGGTLSSGAGGLIDAGGTIGSGAGGENVGGATARSGTGSVPTEITSDNIGDLVFGTYCDFLKACEPKLGPWFPTRQKCLSTMALGVPDGFDHPVFWAKGTSLYQVDKGKADGCISKLAGAACTDGLPLWESYYVCYVSGAAGGGSGSFFGNQLQHLLESLPECQGAMVGTLGQNACCDHRGGCGPGLFCEETDFNSIGSCQPAGAALEECWTRPCQEGLACVKQVCTPYVLLGQECVINNYVGGSAAPSDCKVGLYCDASQQPRRCANADKTAGTACDCFGCAADLYCDFTSRPSVCKTYKSENESCTSSDKCAAGLECMAGICRRIGSLSIGEQCHGDSHECAEGIAGASCLDDGAGITRCSVPGLLGAPCDPNVDSDKTCAFFYDLICDAASRSCQPLPGLGESCQDYCADYVNVFCAHANPTDPNGTCLPRVGLGGNCIKNVPDAGANSCSSDSGTSGCSASGSSSSDSGCGSGLKCDSTTRTCVATTRETCP
jgi:hypothetical protein